MRKIFLILLLLYFSLVFGGDHRFGGTSFNRYQETQDYYAQSKNKVERRFWDRKHFTGDWGGYRPKMVDAGVTITSEIVSDLLGNPAGGMRRGFRQATSWGTDLSLDLEKIASLKGMTFYTSVVQRFGNNLSEDTIGNQFTVAQVYGGQNFRLVSLYLQQDLWDKKIRIRLGRLSAGDTFLQSDLYYRFVNNGFDGNPVGVFINSPSQKVPGKSVFTAYPNATWAAYMRIRPIDLIELKFGVYNANARISENRYHGFNFTFDNTDGVQYITEGGFRINQGKQSSGLPGNYRAGYYYFTGNRDKFLGGQTSGNYGYYFLLDQMVYREGPPGTKQGLTPFLALLFAPGDIDEMPFFFTSGLVYQGLIPGRPEDTTSLGAIYGKYSDDLRKVQQKAKTAGVPGQFGNIPQNYELVLELNHWFQLNQFFYITPDIQIVINPSGLGTIPNAIVLGAQVGVTF